MERETSTQQQHDGDGTFPHKMMRGVYSRDGDNHPTTTQQFQLIIANK
jgi:hypothetical protein